jgi:hypothetical protein
MKASKFLKIGKFFPQVFKMAAIFKMSKDWFFVSFEYFFI